MVRLYDKKTIMRGEIETALRYLKRRWGPRARHVESIVAWLGKRALEEGWVEAPPTPEDWAEMRKRERREGLAAAARSMSEPSA